MQASSSYHRVNFGMQKRCFSDSENHRGGGRQPSTGPNFPLCYKSVFCILWGSVSLKVALETYSARGLGQNLAVLFLKRVLSLLLVSTEAMWDYVS